jgi:hypothetical protein
MMGIGNKSYKYINANTAGTLVSGNGGCVLGSVIINKVGATGNTLTIYDDTAATAANAIAAIDTTRVGLGGNLDFNVVMSRGIFVVLASGTAADLTITYQ